LAGETITISRRSEIEVRGDVGLMAYYIFLTGKTLAEIEDCMLSIFSPECAFLKIEDYFFRPSIIRFADSNVMQKGRRQYQSRHVFSAFTNRLKDKLHGGCYNALNM